MHLARSGEAFQTFRQVRHFLPDKTGTLTEDEVLGFAAAAECPSQHPLARAIVRSTDSRRSR